MASLSRCVRRTLRPVDHTIVTHHHHHHCTYPLSPSYRRTARELVRGGVSPSLSIVTHHRHHHHHHCTPARSRGVRVTAGARELAVVRVFVAYMLTKYRQETIAGPMYRIYRPKKTFRRTGNHA